MTENEPTREDLQRLTAQTGIETSLAASTFPEEGVRCQAARQLGDFDHPRAINRLLEMTGDQCTAVRRAVILALWDKQGTEVKEALLKMREDIDSEVSQLAKRLTTSQRSESQE